MFQKLSLSKGGEFSVLENEKIIFISDGFLLSLAMKQRLEATREWPNIGFKQFF